MANALRLAVATANAQADTFSDRLDNGYLRIYDGAQPATADTPIGAQVLLAELRYSAIASPAASGGVITFNGITPETNAPASGTATWFRALSSDGTTAVYDGSVDDQAPADIVLDSVAITAGGTVAIDTLTHTVPTS